MDAEMVIHLILNYVGKNFSRNYIENAFDNALFKAQTKIHLTKSRKN